MSVTMREEALLSATLERLDGATNNKGGISPSAVISVIDDICADMQLGTCELPQELQRLRAEARNRRTHDDVDYREDHVADLIVMCGLWAA